jgi:ADP-heptose:LPS heptosyltransferase/predicted SAM-dependent methyltransferase
MVWQEGMNSGFHESDKIAHLIVPYTRGHVLELGAGVRKTFPHFTSVDSCRGIQEKGQAIRPPSVDVALDCSKLDLFADESWDSVFSSHLLEHIEQEKVPKVIVEWARVLRTGGYLVLYLPSANLYPKAGTPGANPDHQWDIYPGDIEKLLQENTSCGWTQLEREERDKDNEYSHYLVFKKRDDGKWVEKIWERNPDGKKRALVIRFGAIGDLMQTTSILPGLKEQGYHVTWMAHGNNSGIVANNPNVDEWWLQDQDQVPNNELGSYWTSLEERYDHIINLCESIEGALLTMPGKLTHKYPDEARKRIYGGINYYDRMHDIAAIPRGARPQFFPTDAELKWATSERNKIDAPVIIWCLTGTSHHKTYPFVDSVLKMLLQRTPAHIYLYGDKLVALQLQNAVIECLIKDGVDVSRIHGICGMWNIRESITFAHVADVVIGPETGVINSVSFAKGVEKVIYLSHSSHDNLTRDWVDTTVLHPTEEECPCYPCHRLHFDWTFCHKVEETGASLCTTSIKPDTIFKAALAALIRKAGELGT